MSSKTTPASPRRRKPTNKGLRIDRRFTEAGKDPFASFTFVEREAMVRDFKTGEIKFQLAVEVPDDWDQGAVDVIASKYCRKAGVPQYDADGNQMFDDNGDPVLGPERSAKQVIGRMAAAWRLWGERGSYFASVDDAQAFEDEMAYMIMNQMGAPNSPQWFNTGLFEAYGLTEDAEGNSYWDPELGEIVHSAHKYERSAASACYISSVEDNLVGPGGIMEFAVNEARLFKGGSGSGANLSKIREKNAPLTAGGVSSGVMGFARGHDRFAGAIKSGGTTRRAAKMVILDAEHPDIEEFVHCKVVEEKVARDLIAAGYDSGYDTPGGAYDIVSFQNANHSVRIPRGFMGLLNDDGDLELTSRRDGKVVKTISARQLWDDIAEAAWFSADPGVQFDGIINDWATTPNDGKIRGSNPCFTGDTLVHTDKGLVRFDDMARRAADGETFGVYTHDATNVEVPANKLVLSVADAVMITGVNDIVRLDFSNGAHLRCTPNHRIWTTNRGWVEAQHLTSVDVLLAATEPAGGVFESAHLVSRTDDGREVTYNLSEPRNHSYVANGVVVRNCSEYLHIDDTACNLASVNLGKFFDADRQTFDVDGYIHACRLWTVALEITVAMSHYPTENVARNSYEHRTLGLGFANLGALVMRAGLPYDSREARATMGAVVSIMNSTAYATSAEMAAAVGTCAAYDRNAAEMQRVLRNHRRAAYGTLAGDAGLDGYEHLEVTPVEIDHRVLGRTPFGALSAKIVAQADLMVEAVAAYGARNTQVTVSAPTGTISLQMSCDTSGPEPDFALIKWKKLAGGGYMKIVNQSVPAALRALGYDPATVDQIVTYALGTQTLASPCPINRESLSSAGVADDILDKIEAALPTSGDITMAMAAHVVGNDLYTEHGLDPNTDPAALLLTALGFSNDQIVASSKVMCGHETVEGAPGLRDEDLAVFDTANLCGDGTRFIAWEGHVTALGALQPHLSGGISKTINMPNTATVDDIRAAHELSYELGVKCVAVYRDGCKASQPLSNSIVDGATADDLNEDDPASALPLHAEIVPGMSPVEYYHGKVPLRFRLPKNRAARTFSFEIGGMDCYVTTGEYDDGSLGEIWLNVGRDGSTMRGAFAAFSIAMSLGLQRGVPLEHYVDKYLGHNFAPNGIVIHPNLKMASSIPDAIVRLLGWWYLGRDDLVQVPGEAHAPAVPAPRAAEPPAASTEVGAAAQVLQGGSPYTGDICPNCSSTRMVRSGTCATCADCSATTGCS